MDNISRRNLLIGIGGTAAVSATTALNGCASDSAKTSGSSNAEDLAMEPTEILTPDGWDFPTLAAATLPFVHGVASGDPTDDSVVIWTRVTFPDPSQLDSTDVEVGWEMASDEDFTNPVANGAAITNEALEWTVNVDVSGLESASTYWFRFTALAHTSPTGRTRTAHTISDGELKIASVSCASYWSGYFNTYAQIASRDDLDLVVHAGDHIYDYPDAEEWVRARDNKFDPEYVDFRRWRTAEEIGRRYALYYADPDFAALRANHPMVIAWDNHDIALDDEKTLDPVLPKASFWRWTASRPPVSEVVDGNLVATDVTVEHRHLSYGDADIFVLDVRTHSTDDLILGPDQQAWLEAGLAESASSGKARRIIVSPLPIGRFEVLGNPVYKGWPDRDGDRDGLLAFLQKNEITNNLVLSGDAHGAFIWDIPREQSPEGYDPETGNGSLAVEFLSNSVTRGGSDETTAGGAYEAAFGTEVEADREGFKPYLAEGVAGGADVAAGLVGANASMHYANWTDHGYGLIQIGTEEMTMESWIVPHLEESNSETLDARFSVALGSDHVVRQD